MSPERISASCAAQAGLDAVASVVDANDERTTVQKDENVKPAVEYEPRIKWLDFWVQVFIHSGCLYGIYLALTQAKLLTTVWGKWVERSGGDLFRAIFAETQIARCLCLTLNLSSFRSH